MPDGCSRGIRHRQKMRSCAPVFVMHRICPKSAYTFRSDALNQKQICAGRMGELGGRDDIRIPASGRPDQRRDLCAARLRAGAAVHRDADHFHSPGRIRRLWRAHLCGAAQRRHARHRAPAAGIRHDGVPVRAVEPPRQSELADRAAACARPDRPAAGGLGFGGAACRRGAPAHRRSAAHGHHHRTDGPLSLSYRLRADGERLDPGAVHRGGGGASGDDGAGPCLFRRRRDARRAAHRRDA